MTTVVIGVGFLVFCAVQVFSSLKSREDPKPVPQPILPGELDEPTPSARQAFDSLLVVRKRLAATGCTQEQVAALCDPLAPLLTREVQAQ